MRDRLLVLVAALATGLALAAALPPWGWWPLAFVGLVALDRLIAEQGRGARWRRGTLVGLGLYIPSLAWLLDMTIPGYVIAVVAYAALFGAAMAVVPATSPARWAALPGAIALAELLRWSWPFGGVPLSSLAVGQVSGPLAPVLRLGGTLLLVEVTIIAGVAIAALLSRRWLAGGLAAGLVLVVTVAGALAPKGEQVGTLDVAIVQGGGPQGTRAADTDERLVFERHLEASDGVETPVDLVVWPEDVVDTEGPVETNREGDELADLARELDATLIAGVVEGVDSERFRNASLAYDRDGQVVDRYDKVHRVPFGEYVPLRSLIEPFGGAALTGRDAIVGEHPAYLDTPAGRLSVAISWEVFFGDRVREGVSQDAAIVLNPTNGSSFTGTLVQTQQVASSRMRAIESGRWVLQGAPTGFSAIVGPDGTVHQRTAVSEQAVLQDTVGLREGTTIYTRLGLLPGVLLAVASLLLAAGLVARQGRGAASPSDGATRTAGSAGDDAKSGGPAPSDGDGNSSDSGGSPTDGGGNSSDSGGSPADGDGSGAEASSSASSD